MFFSILAYIVIGLLVVSGIFYVGLELKLFLALGKTRIGHNDSKPLPKVSILVAARNEEDSIEGTIQSILAQDYQGFWEVWVVNDRSTDRTGEILAKYEKMHPDRLHILTVENQPEEGVSPKKHAVSLMVDACNGEILCLTDADCAVKPTWVSGIIREFEPGIELVAGHSYIPSDKNSNLLVHMQAVETMIYRVAGTAGIAMELPLTSTGNNLAYRKSFFKSVGGFKRIEKIQSGDDDLLMQKLAKERPWAMRYCIAEDTFVTTVPKETLKDLWEQRKRWASKTIYYTPKIVLVFSLIFSFLVMQCVGFIAAFFDTRILIAFLATFALKIVSDLTLFVRGLKIFKQTHLIKWSVPLELIHAPFTVLAVVFGVFGRFKWK